MLRIELREERPGYAFFSASKWRGGAEIEISIQRNQDSKYFAENDLWQAEPVWHKVSGMQVIDETLQGTLGPQIIDSLVQQIGNVRYMFAVRDSQDLTLTDSGPVRMVGNILASLASGDSSRNEDVRAVAESIVESAPEPEVEPVIEIEIDNSEEPENIELENEPVTQPEPSSEPKKKSKLALILGGLLLLALLGGAAAYFFLNSSKPAAPTSACDVSAHTGDDLAFLQSCLKSNPEPKQILEIINNAKNANRCSVAQRLYANQAQSGKVDIALAYAAEYENGSSCFAADKSTAIYWYETVLSYDPNNAVATQKLQELKK